MCMNCGCGELNERHGKDSNITAEDLLQSARGNGQEFSQTVRNMEDSLRRVGGGGMSSVGIGSDTMETGPSQAGIRRDAGR